MRMVMKGQELFPNSGVIAQCDLKVIDNPNGTMEIEPLNYPFNVLNYHPTLISVNNVATHELEKVFRTF